MKHEPEQDCADSPDAPGGGHRRQDRSPGLPPVLRVRWREDGLRTGEDRAVFPVHHPYVEVLYTTSIGPLGTILLRRLAEVADGGGIVPTVELAVAVGVRTGTYDDVGGSSRLVKALRRLARFGLVEWSPDGDLAVVGAVAPLPDRQLQRLPESLRRRHAQFMCEAA